MIYIALTLISTLAKLFAFTKVRRIYVACPLHRVIMAFICLLIAQSTFELALYYYAASPESIGALYSLIGFYICLFGVLACLPFIAIIAAGQKINSYVAIAFITFIGGIVYALLFTDWLIAGVELAPATGSLTKISGEKYYIFQVFTLTSMLFSMIRLAIPGKDDNYILRTRRFNLLLAFVPVFAFAFIIVFIMAAGIKFNAVGLLPFCFLIYAAALVHNIHPDKRPDYLTLVPFTVKFKLALKQFSKVMYSHGEVNQAELTDELIDYYLSQKGLKQKDIAEMLNVSKSTVSRRASKYKQ